MNVWAKKPTVYMHKAQEGFICIFVERSGSRLVFLDKTARSSVHSCYMAGGDCRVMLTDGSSDGCEGESLQRPHTQLMLVKRKETQTLTSVVAGTNILHAPSLSSLRFKREGEKGKS